VNPDIVTDADKQLVTRLISFGFDRASAVISRWQVSLDTSEERVSNAITLHTREVANWANEISFKDLQRPRATSEVFVPLDIYLMPRRNRFSSDETMPSGPMDQLLSSHDGHVVILGQPGAGKTTCVKHICQQMLTDDSLSQNQSFPILIQLRDFNLGRTPKTADEYDLILQRLQQVLDIPLQFPADTRCLVPAFDGLDRE
jgi:Cdc6-like AAA superfamily ATPase